jgi:hypothetical protein
MICTSIHAARARVRLLNPIARNVAAYLRRPRNDVLSALPMVSAAAAPRVAAITSDTLRISSANHYVWS